MAGTNFSELIGKLHNNTAKLAESVNETNLLIVNNKRQISATENFDTVIAYEGDINSQIITIQCPLFYDQHDLSACAKKELKWKNIASGMEGVSPLRDNEKRTDVFYLQWDVPSDACTQAGTLEISLTFYDKSGEYVAFAWNTAKYTGLSIGKTIESVNFAFPPKDEILIIDKDTKNIIAPAGYNNTICTYGDVGMTEVYFLINRYLGKKREIDILNEAGIEIYVTMGNAFGSDRSTNRITKRLYTEEIADREKEGLVLITWKVPEGITAGPNGATGLSIMFNFFLEEEKLNEETGELEKFKSKQWNTNIYRSLTIGDNLFQINHSNPEEKWELTTDYITGVIDDYLKNGNFIEEYFSENEFIISDDNK